MMKGSLLRISLVTQKLMRQNRLLLLLMLLWPCVLSGILMVAERGAPARDDVASILAQELFYGLVLVSLAASVALGTEWKARRTQQVLGRAVGRTEYLLALGASAYVPFAGYLLVWVCNAALFAGLLHASLPMLLVTLVAGLSAGLVLCATGLLFSAVLPQIAAAVGTGLVLAGCVAVGRHGARGMMALFGIVSGFGTPPTVPWVPVAEAAGVAFVIVVLAAVLFARKDLP